MDVSIIIVNYNTPAYTLACVESIYKTNSGVSFEVIIVDNASANSGKKFILEKYPKVVWIQNGYNAGFGRANNLGLRRAIANVILFLNSDTVVVGDSIVTCFSRMIQSAETVAAGVQLLNADGSKQDSMYDNFYWANLTEGIPYAGWLLKHPLALLKKILRGLSGSQIGYLNGAFLMVKREVLVQTGGFDEDFFLYAEETELCTRLRLKGKLEYYKDLFVYHIVQGSKTNDAFHYGQQQLSIQLFVRKKFGIVLYLFVLFLHGISLHLNLISSFIKFIINGKITSFEKFKTYFQTFVVWVKFAPKIILRTSFLFKFSSANYFDSE